MLNRWTYGWLGKPEAAPPLRQTLDSPPSPTPSFKTALDYEDDSNSLPGGWIKPLKELRESGEEAGGRFPPFPSLSSHQPSTKEQSRRRRIARFEDDPVSVPPLPAAHPPPTVSPETLGRLKSKLASRTSPPRTDELNHFIARDFAHPDEVNFPSTNYSKLRKPSTSRSPNLEIPRTSARRTKPFMSDVSTIKASRMHQQKPSWENEWKELVETKKRDPSKFEGEQKCTRTMGAEERGRTSGLPELAEHILIEGTLLAPPPSFTSTREISRLHREYWISCQAILTTRALHLLVPSEDFSTLQPQMRRPSDSSSDLTLDLDEFRSLNKPTDVKDRDELYPFEVKLVDGKKLYLATETAKDWMIWTSTIKQHIDLVKGRAPPSPENVADLVRGDDLADTYSETSRPIENHLEDLKRWSKQLEQEDSRGFGKREEERTRLNDWMREMLHEARCSAPREFHEEEDPRKSRSQGDQAGRNRDTSPRRLLKPRPEQQRRPTMVDATVQVSEQPETPRAARTGRTTSRRKYQGPDPKELLELFKQQQDHLEESRRFEQDQSKALVYIIKDLHSNREALYNTVPVLHQALSTIKEAQQAQADTLLAFAERLKSKTTKSPANPTRQQLPLNVARPVRTQGSSQAVPPSWARAAMRQDEGSSGRGRNMDSRSSENGFALASAPLNGVTRHGDTQSKLRRASPERRRT
ncbi:hypothetical protein JCM5350_005916 [Sporobolomyces pararoseus]